MSNGGVRDVEFQSTLLMRGATRFAPCLHRRLHFNPRSSCEERPDGDPRRGRDILISIHAPHARSDILRAAYDCIVKSISIHAPHARSDLEFIRHFPFFQSYFNPRSSCEERRSRSSSFSSCSANFNPRSSCEERHGRRRPDAPRGNNFNPRSSCEERRLYMLTT